MWIWPWLERNRWACRADLNRCICRSGHDHTGNVLQALQQLREEPLGRLCTAPALDQDVEHGAVLVDRPPQVVLLAADAKKDLIRECQEFRVRAMG